MVSRRECTMPHTRSVSCRSSIPLSYLITPSSTILTCRRKELSTRLMSLSMRLRRTMCASSSTCLSVERFLACGCAGYTATQFVSSMQFNNNKGGRGGVPCCAMLTERDDAPRGLRMVEGSRWKFCKTCSYFIGFGRVSYRSFLTEPAIAGYRSCISVILSYAYHSKD